MKFRIGVMEVHRRWVEVEAEDADEAIKKVILCEGDEDTETEMMYTLDEDQWTVKGEDENA